MELTEEQINAITGRVRVALLTTPNCWGDPSRIKVGQNVTLVNTLFNTSGGSITIGDDTFFGHNVCLLTGSHDIQKRGRGRQVPKSDSGADIVIGRGVWLASNVTVIGPCVIGDYAVVAAGSVVFGGELRANYIYAGMPAKAIKAVDFDEEEQPQDNAAAAGDA